MTLTNQSRLCLRCGGVHVLGVCPHVAPTATEVAAATEERNPRLRAAREAFEARERRRAAEPERAHRLALVDKAIDACWAQADGRQPFDLDRLNQLYQLRRHLRREQGA